MNDRNCLEGDEIAIALIEGVRGLRLIVLDACRNNPFAPQMRFTNSTRSLGAGLARVEPGEAVLDIGCGTGSLAIAAKRRVGPSGLVHGIDASPEMIVRARKKASRAGIS